ncbi:MAG: chaperone NapD [Geminicoccales bacterium]
MVSEAKVSPSPGSGDETHISSLVVQVKPASMTDVVRRIAAIEQTEVPIADPKGKLVICIETATLGEVADCIDVITKLPGVLGCTLVSHHVEDTAGLDELIDPYAHELKETTA